MNINMYIFTAHESVVLYRLTLFTAPQAPVNLQVIERTPHGMIVTWQHPSITNGKLREFIIRVKLLSSHLRRQGGKKNSFENLLKVEQRSMDYSYKVSES
jgi:Fe-S cluster assembly ATPase SufC